MTRALVVAPAWPPELPPIRLVRTLVSSGTKVTVAVAGKGRRAFEAAGASVLALPGVGAPGARAVLALAASAPKAARSSRSRSALGAAVTGGSGLDRMEALWRLLPLAVQPWDELYLPSGKEAVAYRPAMALASRSVVMVDRPPALAAADLLGAADEVRCSSASLAQAASERGARAGALTVTPPPPPDPGRFRPGERPPSARLRLVCTAPFHWSGGHDYLLVALRHLLDRGLDVSCALVDDGPEPQRLLYTVVDLELAGLGPDGRPQGDVVTVHRHPSIPETADLLRGSDVFVLAAVEDRPWPEIAEALACGLPVIASDVPSIAETSGVTVVPPRDPDALADAIASVGAGVVRGAS